MYRNLIVIALIALLAACANQGNDGASQSDEPSMDTEPSMAASASAPASDGASTGEASEACASAFATLEGVGVESLSDLVDVDGVDATLNDCESVGDWIAGAETLIEDVNPSTAELLLGIQCDQPGLSNTPICEEIASS